MDNSKTCSTCHWWFSGVQDKDGRKVCVFHNGMKTAHVRRIDFGGSKPLMTLPTFGCTDWEVDKRKKPEETT